MLPLVVKQTQQTQWMHVTDTLLPAAVQAAMQHQQPLVVMERLVLVVVHCPRHPPLPVAVPIKATLSVHSQPLVGDIVPLTEVACDQPRGPAANRCMCSCKQ